MDAKSQVKVIEKGFIIIRVDDYPAIRIQFKDEEHREWTTLNNFPTKTARDRAFNDLLEQPMVITDQVL